MTEPTGDTVVSLPTSRLTLHEFPLRPCSRPGTATEVQMWGERPALFLGGQQNHYVDSPPVMADVFVNGRNGGWRLVKVCPATSPPPPSPVAFSLKSCCSSGEPTWKLVIFDVTTPTSFHQHKHMNSLLCERRTTLEKTVFLLLWAGNYSFFPLLFIACAIKFTNEELLLSFPLY